MFGVIAPSLGCAAKFDELAGLQMFQPAFNVLGGSMEHFSHGRRSQSGLFAYEYDKGIYSLIYSLIYFATRQRQLECHRDEAAAFLQHRGGQPCLLLWGFAAVLAEVGDSPDQSVLQRNTLLPVEDALCQAGHVDGPTLE